MIKIDDEIYKEIDSFQDYELVQCVAYEMAIRNHKVLEKIEDAINYFKENKKSILSHKRECTYYFGGQTNIPFCKLLQMIKNIEVLSIDWDKLELNYYEKRVDKRLYIILQMLRPINYRMKQFNIIEDSLVTLLENYDFKSSDKDDSLKVVNKVLFKILPHNSLKPTLKDKIRDLIANNEKKVLNTNYVLSEILSILDKTIKYFPQERLLVETEDGYSLFTDDSSIGLTRIYKQSVAVGYKIIHELKLKNSSNIFKDISNANNKKPLKDFINIKSIGELADYVYIPTKNAISLDSDTAPENIPNNNIINLVSSSNRIEPNFKRPILNIDSTQTKKIIGEIDFSLPKKVLDAYIKHIKQGVDNNPEHLIMTPLEILGEDFQAFDKKVLKTTLVSSFFVYDYVKSQAQEAISINQTLKEKLQTNIEQIKKDRSFFGKDEIEWIVQEKKQVHKKTLASVSIHDILGDLDSLTNIPFSTSKKQYFRMKSYIEDEKYNDIA